MAANRKNFRLLLAALAAAAFAVAAPAARRADVPGSARSRRGRVGSDPPGVLLEPGSRRRQLRVPGRSRPELQLARPRPRRGKLRDAQHPRDAEEDASERQVLVASPGDEQGRRRVAVDEPALAPSSPGRLVPTTQAPGLRLSVHLPGQPDLRRLDAGSVCRQLHVLARERPRPREHRPEQRTAGRDLGDELRAELHAPAVGDVLLERRPGRLRGQPRRSVAGLVLQLLVAVGDDSAA